MVPLPQASTTSDQINGYPLADVHHRCASTMSSEPPDRLSPGPPQLRTSTEDVLLDQHTNGPTTDKAKPRNSYVHKKTLKDRFRDLMAGITLSPEILTRTSGFTLLKQLLRALLARNWQTHDVEQPKVVMKKDRRVAALRCILHIIPVSAAMTLIVLNLKQYYVGGELAGQHGHDDQKLGALQFAAKLHELLMIASLATSVFTYIRRELVFGEGVPFGALSAGLEIDKASFLYSPNLWGAIWAEWHRKRKKWTLLTILISATMLGITVGPSTANLMRPRLLDWPAGGTDFWVGVGQDELSPELLTSSQSTSHCMDDLNDQACPHAGWELIGQQYQSFWPQLQTMGSMPESLNIPSPFSMRTMTVRQRSTEDDNSSRAIWQNAYSLATVQQSVIADALSEVGRLWAYAAANNNLRQQFVYRRQATFTTPAYQPITQARCHEIAYFADEPKFAYSFPILQAPSPYYYIDPQPRFTLTDTTLIRKLDESANSYDNPTLTWLDRDELRAPTNNSIYAVAFFPNTTSNDTRLYCCTIDSIFTETRISATRNWPLGPKYVTGSDRGMLGLGTSLSGAIRTKIDPSWAAMLNPYTASGQNATVFSHLASSAGVWNSSHPAKYYNFPFIVESILAQVVANGVARSTYNSTMVGQLKGANPGDPWEGGFWVEAMFPRHGLGWGGAAFDIDPATAAVSTMFTMQATVNGYAWSYIGKIQVAAITTMLAYSIFAIAHISWALGTGWSSASWDSTQEIVALAINSRMPYSMHDTGAGIDTIKPMKEKVVVRDMKSRVEYVFRGQLDRGAPVRPGRYYS